MLWDYSFPMNKHIWTSSYVLFSSGLAMLFLASCIWIIDLKKKTKPFHFGIVFGSNAIFAYVLHSMLWRLFQIPIFNEKGIQQNWMDFGISTGSRSSANIFNVGSLLHLFYLLNCKTDV